LDNVQPEQLKICPHGKVAFIKSLIIQNLSFTEGHIWQILSILRKRSGFHVRAAAGGIGIIRRINLSVQCFEKFSNMVFTTMPNPVTNSGIRDTHHRGGAADAKFGGELVIVGIKPILKCWMKLN
jgi:hypothetical protein